MYHVKERAVDLEAALGHAQGQLVQAQASEAQARQALAVRAEAQGLAEREMAEAKEAASRMFKQVGSNESLASVAYLGDCSSVVVSNWVFMRP